SSAGPPWPQLPGVWWDRSLAQNVRLNGLISGEDCRGLGRGTRPQLGIVLLFCADGSIHWVWSKAMERKRTEDPETRPGKRKGTPRQAIPSCEADDVVRQPTARSLRHGFRKPSDEAHPHGSRARELCPPLSEGP